MVICSRIIAGKLRIIFKVCVCTNKGRRGSAKCGQVCARGESGVENH